MDNLLIFMIAVAASGWLLPTDIPKAITTLLEALSKVLGETFCFNHMNAPIEMTENLMLQVQGSKLVFLQIFFSLRFLIFSQIFTKFTKFYFSKCNATELPYKVITFGALSDFLQVLFV